MLWSEDGRELHGASTYHSIVTWSNSALWAFIRTERQVSVCILQLSRKLIQSSSEALTPRVGPESPRKSLKYWSVHGPELLPVQPDCQILPMSANVAPRIVLL